MVLGQKRDTSNGAAETPVFDPAVEECAGIDPDSWFALSNWAKETSNLQPWQRKLAYDIGVRIKRGRPPSPKQAQYGKRILDEARRLGFSVSDQP